MSKSWLLWDNPNAPTKYGETTIYLAEADGHTEIIEILTPWTDNPNDPKRWVTSIHGAASRGHTEIVKILSNQNVSKLCIIDRNNNWNINVASNCNVKMLFKNVREFKSLDKLQTQFSFDLVFLQASQTIFQFRFALFNLETDEIAKNMLIMILIS